MRLKELPRFKDMWDATLQVRIMARVEAAVVIAAVMVVTAAVVVVVGGG